MDQYFSLDEVLPEERVTVTSLRMDDIALQWHKAYMRSRSHLPLPSWEEYMFALSDRFGAEYDDLMCDLLKVKHTGSVVEF